MDSLPPWSVVQSMLLAVVLPGFAVSAGLLAGVCRATRSERARLLGGAFALVGGLAAGNLTRGLLPWWSIEVGWPSLFPATAAAAFGGVAAARAVSRMGGGWEMSFRLVAGAGCALWLAPAGQPLFRLGIFALLFGGCALIWEAFRREGSRSLGRGALLVLAVPWGGAAATVLILAHSARFCDLAVLLTATLAGVGLIAARWKLDAAALFAAPAVFLPALMFGGLSNTFSEVPGASFILVALAPGALWILRLPPMRHWSGRPLAIAAIVAVLIPCAVAVFLARSAETLMAGEFGIKGRSSASDHRALRMVAGSSRIPSRTSGPVIPEFVQFVSPPRTHAERPGGTLVVLAGRRGFR